LMPRSLVTAIGLLAVLLTGWTFWLLSKPQPNTPLPTPAASAYPSAMTSAADAFLATLDEASRQEATFAFSDAERFNWHYVPRMRKGLALKAMTLDQRRAAHTLMRTVLTDVGYQKATHIMQLEAVLAEMENDPVRRDPENYSFSVFGAPSGDAPWGWRLEGHHLSLNFSSATGALTSAAPAFFGANPAEVRTGPSAGLRVLGAEEDDGRALMLSLTDAQQAQALLDPVAYPEIVSGTEREALPVTFAGLPASAFTDAQRTALRDLVALHARHLTHHETYALAQLDATPADSVFFGWAGTTGVGEPHYYRIHTPRILIEYDHVQNDANHAHAVWRDLTNDFGMDALRQHYLDKH
ncbi:MAG: DUF3500 domain-containing protein, partial [Bacteroidota bacterium]